MTPEKNNKEIEREKARGKRRLQERMAEEAEAQKLIDDYKKQPPEEPYIDADEQV